MSDQEVLAVVPARGGSKSIEKKNIVDLAGRPLVEYTFDAAVDSSTIDRTVLSTDDDEIASVGHEYDGVEVPFMRPDELAQDDSPTIPVIQHAVRYLREEEEYDPDIVLILQPTSPLRRATDIDEAIETLREHDADSVVSVIEVPHEYNPYSVMEVEGGELVHFCEEGGQYNRRQDKPTFYARNGAAVYAITTRTLMEESSLYGDHCRPYLMERRRSVDIDDHFDLEIAEMVLQDDPPSDPE